MSGISNTNKTIIAFKNLLGKSQTDSAKELGNEEEGLKFNLHSDTIFTHMISSSPATAVSTGTAVGVQAVLTADPTSNGHAYFAKWPATPPSGIDPLTLLAYAYGAGTLTGILAGDRVINAIAPLFGSGYEAVPYAGTIIPAHRIPVNDPRNWIYQYQSGVFFQENTSGSAPTFITMYAYTGQTLTQALEDSPANLWVRDGEDIRAVENAASSPLIYPNILPPADNVSSIGNSSNVWLSVYANEMKGNGSLVNLSSGVILLDTSNGNQDLAWMTIADSGNEINAPTGTHHRYKINNLDILDIDDTGIVLQESKFIWGSTSLSQIDMGIGVPYVYLTTDAGAGNEGFLDIETTYAKIGFDFNTGLNYLVFTDGAATMQATNTLALVADTSLTVQTPDVKLTQIASGFHGSEVHFVQGGVQTTNATTTNIKTIAITPLGVDEMISVEVRINGLKSNYTAAYGAKLFAVFRKSGGLSPVITQVSTTDLIEKTEFATATSAISVNGTAGIKITVTGEAATTINWVASVTYHKTQTNI